MFWPQPVKAHDVLKDLKEPARAVAWRPAESYVSCDGTMAVNTGPTRWPDGRVGYFSTIWQKGVTGWRWSVDHGDFTAAPRWRWTAAVVRRRGACTGTPTPPPEVAFRCAPDAGGTGRSADGTLAWAWYVGACAGGRQLIAWLWDGTRWQRVLQDTVATRP